MKKLKQEIILLIVILLFALFLRVYSLGKPPLWIDEAISANVAKNILGTRLPYLDSGLLYNRAYLFHYIQAFFMLFGQNEFFSRFPSVIFGMLTILLAYFIGKEYSKKGGIISALFFSVFYLEVFFSRQARFYQLFQLAFFVCLYFLYKSKENGKENKKYLYLSLICFFIAWDTQIEALVLAPFIILHILIYNNQKWLAVFPTIPLVLKFLPVVGLSGGITEQATNYAKDYFAFAYKMRYLLVLFIFGVIWSYIEIPSNLVTLQSGISNRHSRTKGDTINGNVYINKKRLTLLLVLPSLITLFSIFTLKSFALRYSYFFVFPLILYSSLLLSFLYEKYGKIILIVLIAVLLYPSNLFFPNYVNVIKPVDYNLRDYSAPYTDYKSVPDDLIVNMRNSTLVSLFSADFEFYIKKPDLVVPFTMTGMGTDTISMNSSKGLVDMYSGARIWQGEKISKPYYVTADSFSISKLKSFQSDKFNTLVENCSVSYNSYDLKIYYCS